MKKNRKAGPYLVLVAFVAIVFAVPVFSSSGAEPFVLTTTYIAPDGPVVSDTFGTHVDFLGKTVSWLPRFVPRELEGDRMTRRMSLTGIRADIYILCDRRR